MLQNSFSLKLVVKWVDEILVYEEFALPSLIDLSILALPQLPDRSAGGVLKTNLSMVTIRTPAIASSLPAQSRGVIPVQSLPPPRVTVSVPMLVPTSNAIRKQQQLAPKVI